MAITKTLLISAIIFAIGCTAAAAAVDPFVQVKNGVVVEKGIASWYGYNAGAPACGIPMGARTAAHKTLPCGSKVRVTRGDKSIVVTIVDRGPFVAGRIIDLSPPAARALGISGIAPVTVERVQ
jgi:rare lipoprotein A